MKKIFFAGVALMVAGMVMAKDDVKGYRATISMSNGNTVQTEYWGWEDGIDQYFLAGKLNGQRVRYELYELKEIIFTDNKNHSYSEKNGGPVIVVSASGKRFTLTDAGIDIGHLKYCYLDPVTESRKFTYTPISGSITSIQMGDQVGAMKKNPATNEYFPATYSFDPYTGQKLIWANPAE
jgi:hypothetical protein